MIETSGSANWRDRLAVALPWLTLAWIGVMLASLYWGFLNRFVIGSWHGAWGLDFFSVPRAWENLLAGESIYDTAASQFGPRPTATWYPYHPVLAVVVGSWTRQLPPAWSYLTFVAFSLALLAFSGWLLARLAKDRLTGRIMFASLFFGPAIYLMLFIGQMHIFTVLAMALIFAGIWQLQSEDGPACRRAEWLIAAGLLAAFFSKPVVALFLPTLLLVRETRRATLASLGVYLVVSLVFLYVPALNARGLNFIHWANILTISQSTKMMAHLGHIFELPMSENPEIFSLPTWVDHLVGGHVNPQVFRLPVLFVVIVSFWVAWRPERTERLRLTVVVVMLAVCSYYLGYPCVWEYHYTTLLPCVAMLVLLYSEESDPARRRMLAIALGLGASVFLPTLYFLFHAHPVREVIEPAMTMCRATRVLPVLGLYLVLLADLLRRLRGIPPETLAAPSAASSGERRRDKLKAARVH